MCKPYGEDKWCDYSCESPHECGVPEELQDLAENWWDSEKAEHQAPVEIIMLYGKAMNEQS